MSPISRDRKTEKGKSRVSGRSGAGRGSVGVACGFVRLVGADVYDDLAQAATVWRGVVGEAAHRAAPSPVEASDDLRCLVQLGFGEPAIIGSETRAVTDNWFRATRRRHDLADDPVTVTAKALLPKSLLANPSPARDAPHPAWRRCRQSTHKPSAPPSSALPAGRGCAAP